MGMLSEFREFAVKGNVVDMTVGIIVGGAFGKIVSSFVADVVMPPIGLLLGGMDFSNLVLTLTSAEGKTAAVTLNYGKFITTVLDFVIIAFVIFLAIRAMNAIRRKESAAPVAAPAPTPEQVLLTEIRDALRERK